MSRPGSLLEPRGITAQFGHQPLWPNTVPKNCRKTVGFLLSIMGKLSSRERALLRLSMSHKSHKVIQRLICQISILAILAFLR